MKCPGGYQIIDFKGETINASTATIIKNNEIAEILRNTKKPVYITGLTDGALGISCPVILIADTGARDGKAFIIDGYIISTNNENITVTPSDQA